MTKTNNENKDFPITWEELHRNSKALAWKLLDKGPLEGRKWKGIMAITRGGMVPACIIARELDILLVETFCISSYDDKEHTISKIIKEPDNIDNDGLGWLVIDDLVDTGKTFELARKSFPKAHYACIYTKPKGEKQTDTSVMGVSQDTWIVFPWEV